METPYQIFSVLRPEKRLVAEALKGKEFETVLEVGTQWGEILKGVKDQFSEANVIGVDVDKPVVEEAAKVTGLDLRVGNLFDLQFEDKSFDVVCAEALFVMLPPGQIESGVDEMLRVAKKYLILIELEIPEFTGYAPGGRTGANWEKIFEKRGLHASVERIPKEAWNAEPWMSSGAIITVEL